MRTFKRVEDDKNRLYCEHCGTEMVIEVRYAKKYNMETGERIKEGRFICPKNKHWFDRHYVGSWHHSDEYSTWSTLEWLENETEKK